MICKTCNVHENMKNNDIYIDIIVIDHMKSKLNKANI